MVIFDIGQILVQVDFAQGILPLVASRAGGGLQEILRTFREHPELAAFLTGQLTIPEFHDCFQQALGIQLSYDEFVDHWCGVFQPAPEMEQLAYEVSQRVRTGLLSDIDALHWDYLSHKIGFLSTVPRPTLSFRTGVLKPDHRAFRLAAYHAEASIENCLLVDDRLENVQGAIAAGMQALHFTSEKDFKFAMQARGLL